MCGICGIYDRVENSLDNSAVIQNMMKTLTHRGPDDARFLVDEKVTLGFVRLSIMDLQDGMQPMYNEDQSIVTICNGEIYNYKELRAELKEKGHVFHTECDVEVISHLYEEHGPQFIKRLNGQFAICVYDRRKKELFLGRDYVGIAPLFYTKVGDSLIFGSEMKSILAYPGVDKTLDITALDQMVSFPGILAPRTIFKHIKSVESGHYLLIKEEEIQNCEYWDLNFDGVMEEKTEQEHIACLEEALRQAVKYRLNASVPVGFYISGGLDSSIIAGMINKEPTDCLRHSFSIDFMQKDISERKYQKMVRSFVKSNHHERLFGTDDIVSNLKDVIYYSESVLKETYNTASYVLSGLVRDNDMKVVLTGEGADELFGGYVGYKFDKMRQQMGQKRSAELSEEDRRINHFLWGDEFFTYEKNHGAFDEQKLKLYSKTLADSFQEFACTSFPVVDVKKLEHMDLLQKRSYLDFKMRLSDHLLSDHGDRMAYAHSVEARYPFLDLNVIETAQTIPSELKLKGFTEKYILKKIAKEYVPEQIINRPKFAFVAPGSTELLKSGDEYISDILSYETIKRQGIFNPDYIEQLKIQYSQPGFKLNLPYDSDMLIIVITMGILMDVMNVSGL